MFGDALFALGGGLVEFVGGPVGRGEGVGGFAGGFGARWEGGLGERLVGWIWEEENVSTTYHCCI